MPARNHDIRRIQHEVLIRLGYSQGQEERTRVGYGTGIFK